MLTLDFVAKRYGMLPSHVISQGSSYDVYVADLAVSYENYQHRRAQGQAPAAPHMSQEQLQAMVDRVRNKK